MNEDKNSAKESGETQTLFVSSLVSTAAFGGAEIEMRNYLSPYHLWGAAHFAMVASQLEEGWDRNSSMELIFRHRSYVVGCIVLCVAYIEAILNELLSDAFLNNDGNAENSNRLDSAIVIQLESKWKAEAEQNKPPSALDQYREILQFAQKKQFSKGDKIYQRAQNLGSLRNALLHYRPQTVPVEPVKGLMSKSTNPHKKLAQKLRADMKPPLNPFFTENNPAFPDQFLCYKCAKWAVDSSKAFTNEFFKRLGIEPRPFPLLLPELPPIE
jgi:hypothetical protein